MLSIQVAGSHSATLACLRPLQSLCIWQLYTILYTLKRKCCHFDETFVTGCVHRKLSFWQLPMQPVTNISSKRYFRFRTSRQSIIMGCDHWTYDHRDLSWCQLCRHWWHQINVVVVTTYGAASDNRVGIMITFGFQWYYKSNYFSWQVILQIKLFLVARKFFCI